MRKIAFILPLSVLFSCGNEVEEITDPSTGIVLKKYEYYMNDTGQKVKDGTYTEWNYDGSIKWTANYQDGKLDGEEIVYLKPDSIVYNNYKNDVRSGKSRIEFKGVVIRDLNYSNGKLNGKQQYFFSNGKLNVVGFMKDNLTINTWRHYDEHGRVRAIFTYNSCGAPNELIGTWREQNKRGKEVYFVFNEVNAGEFYAPLYKRSTNAVLQMQGVYKLGKDLVLQDGVNIISMEILSFEKDKLTVMQKNGEVVVYIREA